MTPHSLTYLKDYQAPAFILTDVALHFELGDSVTHVRSQLNLQRAPTSNGAEPLILQGEHLKLISIALDDQELKHADYQLTTHTLTIPHVPVQFSLTITVQIKPQENTALSGLYKSGAIFCTQCEAEGFRRITYFLDRPDVLTRFTTTIVADKTRYPVLLSNGNLIASGELDANQHWVTWQDPFKKSSYLFALVAGALDCLQDTFITQSGHAVSLEIYVDPGNLDKADYAMTCIKKAMAWDERAYGREYDLDRFMVVAIQAFNMGAMENKGLNIFNAKYILANAAISTDLDYQNILRVVGHEYFHNWSGNRVTCRDWFQLSLKEGLTIFREQEFFADMTSQQVARIDEVRVLRGRQFIEDAGPLAHSVRPEAYLEINNFYTNTIYNKGAEVIRMQKVLLGPAKFRQAMDLYFERFDGQAVTIEDFVSCMEEVGERDLTQFRRWYQQAGTPELAINYDYIVAEQLFTLTVQQSCPATPGQSEKQPFYLPLAMGLLGVNGESLMLQLEDTAATTAIMAENHTAILILKEPQQTFKFINVAQRPVPALLRGFSAPVKLQVAYTDAELLFLLRYERDGFARWNAGFQLACIIMLRMINTQVAVSASHFPIEFGDALRVILLDTTLDKGFITDLLTLPSESYLGELMTVIDVDAIKRVHRYLQQQIAQHLQVELLHTYTVLHAAAMTDLSETAMAARRLKNLCLQYLMQLPETTSLALCLEQYNHANTMTDRLAAFGVLIQQPRPMRAALIESFYQQWQHESLVIDKWLSLQAMADVPDALQQIQALMLHACFDIKTPNKVYALLGVFAQNNAVHFHAVSGAGYQFLADNVIKLNHLNPQVAARMVEPLTRWRRYDAARQKLMQAQLQRILAEPNLSKDVLELVSKSLA